MEEEEEEEEVEEEEEEIQGSPLENISQLRKKSRGRTSKEYHT